MEARSLGRFRTLAISVLSPEGLYRRLALLFAALLVPVLLAYVVPRILKIDSGELSVFTRLITGAVTLIGGIATWISAQTKRGTELIGKLEAAYERVKKSRRDCVKVRKHRRTSRLWTSALKKRLTQATG